MQGALYVSNVRLNPETGKPIFVIAAPVMQQQDTEIQTPVGILYAKVDVQYFAGKFIEPARSAKRGVYS